MAGASAYAEVKLMTRPDGTRYMYNTGRSSRPTPLRQAAPPPGVDLEAIISEYSRQNRLDPDLVRAVIRAESSFNARAVSRQGAMGLMQLMPATAKAMSVADPFDPEENVRGGTLYLRQMLDAFRGSLELALAAYNAGPEAVRRFAGVPPYRETIEYVEKVMRLYNGDSSYAVRATPSIGRGRQTFLGRDAAGRLTLSTTPPGMR
jgi:soluble lytic murein transglycosylase